MRSTQRLILPSCRDEGSSLRYIQCRSERHVRRSIGRCLVLPASLVLGCGTEPIGDVTGDYVLTARFAGAASECSLTGAQLSLTALSDGSLAGSLEGGDLTCERSDPATPFPPQPAEVRGMEEDGDLIFSLWSPEGTAQCSLFVFTIRNGGASLSGSLHTVQQFCQGLPEERVTGTWTADPVGDATG